MNKKALIFNILLVILVVVTVNKSIAQQKERKEEKLEITINNGDTTVNGKNFKNITEEEKVALRKSFKPMQGRGVSITMDAPHIDKRVRMIKKGDVEVVVLDSGKNQFYSFNKEGRPMNFEFQIDSLKKNMKLFSNNTDREIREVFVKRFGEGADVDWEMVHPNRLNRNEGMHPMPMNSERMLTIHRPNMPNSSHFNYTTTDKDGFTTEQHIQIMDAGKLDFINTLKNDESAMNSLEIKNLVFYPNFSNGKTTINFQAPAKATLEINLLDNEGKTLFAEKKTLSADAYSKDLTLNKNGIYFLEVKQGSKSFIKKIIKN